MVATDYSQRGEQTYILEALDGVSAGRFLDVGACHPTCFSNTRALFELGWSGVMIEPSPGPLQSLLLEYAREPRIQIVAAAVSFETGLAEMHATEDLTSTIDEAHWQRWKTICKFYAKYYVPTLTLADIFNRFGGDFAFVNIDAEGISGRLAMALLETECIPRCLCIEHDSLANNRGTGALDFLARQRGYRQVHCNGENVIYGLPNGDR